MYKEMLCGKREQYIFSSDFEASDHAASVQNCNEQNTQNTLPGLLSKVFLHS